MLLVWTVFGCGWWEAHQACSAARAAEETAWSAFQSALAADAGALTVDAALTQARALDTTVAAEAAKATTPKVNAGEAAQDAFTRASRAYGTEKGLAQAGWTDWSLRAQGHATAADQQTARVAHTIERLDAWGDVLVATRTRLALLRTRYDAALRTGEPRLAIALTFGGTGDLAAPPDPAGEALTTLLAEAKAAAAEHELRIADHKAALDDAHRLVFDVERAAQTATSDAADYPFLGFPAEAQVAQAAALAAGAAGSRGTDAVTRLRAALTAHQGDAERAPVMPPASLSAAGTASTAVKATLAACE